MARIPHWIAIENDKICVTDDHHNAVKKRIQSNGYSNPDHCPAQLYQNLLCAHVWSEWFTQEAEDVIPQPFLSERNQFVLLHFVPGVSFQLGSDRLVLIPTIDLDPELSVPQEWIDIPDWVADYYVSVQLDLDENWLKVIGYATHQQLKQQGSFVEGDRSYCLPDDALQEQTGLLISRTLAPHPRTAVAPLATLTPTTAQQLLQTLRSTPFISPRYCFPFPQWAALVSDRIWREQLFQQQSLLPVSPIGQFTQWLQTSWQDRRSIRELFDPTTFNPIPFSSSRSHTPSDAIKPIASEYTVIELIIGNTPIALSLGDIKLGFNVVCELTQTNSSSSPAELRVRIVAQVLNPLPALGKVHFQIAYSDESEPLEWDVEGEAIASSEVLLPELLGTSGEVFRLTTTLANHSAMLTFKL